MILAKIFWYRCLISVFVDFCGSALYALDLKVPCSIFGRTYGNVTTIPKVRLGFVSGANFTAVGRGPLVFDY